MICMFIYRKTSEIAQEYIFLETIVFRIYRLKLITIYNTFYNNIRSERAVD